MSSKTICKEQCSKCKCVVKEKILNEKKDDGCCEKKSSCVEEKKSYCDKKNDCNDVYRDLGECLKKAIVSAAKKEDRSC